MSTKKPCKNIQSHCIPNTQNWKHLTWWTYRADKSIEMHLCDGTLCVKGKKELTHTAVGKNFTVLNVEPISQPQKSVSLMSPHLRLSKKDNIICGDTGENSG